MPTKQPHKQVVGGCLWPLGSSRMSDSKRQRGLSVCNQSLSSLRHDEDAIEEAHKKRETTRMRRSCRFKLASSPSQCYNNNNNKKKKNKNNTSNSKQAIKMLLLRLTCSLLALASLAQINGQQLFGPNAPVNSKLPNSGSQQPSSAAVLLDTTEQISLGWTKYPDGGSQTRTTLGWVEESFTNFERGINWRSFVVCDVAHNSVNNWLWTPFIERGDANRLYIEIKFTMRDCNLFPQMVLSCKETFALLYKEMDSPIGSTSLPGGGGGGDKTGWQQQSNASFAQSDSYTLIDTIAADEGRFTSTNDVVINTEIRSIPVSKRGVYFAFRDQGACLSLISVKIYHLRCPQISLNLAQFNATATGKDLTSLVAVEGSCAPNSIQLEQPKMFCSADGNWNSMSSGQCKCLAGFEPTRNQTKCQACPPNTYKSSLGDSTCQLCPERSSASSPASSECRCLENYFRAPKDPRSAACTQPPGPPSNLSAIYVDSSSVILQWQAPKFTGNRDDLTYKLICDQQTTNEQQQSQQQQLQQQQTTSNLIASSPSYLANFSETKCVLSGLQPGTSYRFLVYAMNGVSHLSGQLSSGPQFSEISLQTSRPVQQTTGNTLSGQGGLQLTPIYNMRALPGARGTDMVLAWDAQPLGQSGELAGLDLSGNALPSSPGDQLPSLYEIRYQPRHLLMNGAGGLSQAELARRSPYPASLLLDQLHVHQVSGQQVQPQTLTTTNRALVITTLTPRTEYAFQIRAKWAHSSQWSEFSEPIYMATSNQVPPHYLATSAADNLAGGGESQLAGGQLMAPYLQQPSGVIIQSNQVGQPAASSGSSWTSWLSSFALFVLCTLIALSLLSLTLVHLRKSTCLQSLAGNFNAPGSAYAGVYGSGHLSPHQLHLGAGGLHHTMLGSGSAGGLITGSNATSRSSSGAGNVVQNFIAATLNQISGGSHHNHNHNQHLNNSNSNNHHHSSSSALSGTGNGHAKAHCGANGTIVAAHTMAAGQEGKLFATNGNQLNQQQRNNHYHQTMSHQHTMLLSSSSSSSPHNNNNNNQAPAHLQQLPPLHSMVPAHLVGQTASGALDAFKYRTLNQSSAGAVAGAQFMQQDPQMHIYDDLDTTTCSSLMQQHQQQQQQQQQSHRQQVNEIDPQQVIIKSVIGRGEFGDVCLALLRNGHTGIEQRVAVKTLKMQANEKAKLDFLVEASIMCQFEHPNIIHLEGLVTKSEPAMIVTEFMENGALDSYLRENKNRFSCHQLISMLRGIANGMQYLAKLNYVHKDLAGRNILVNEHNVCKIADFGLSAHQAGNGNSNSSSSGNHNHQLLAAGGPLQADAAKSANSPLANADYINDSGSLASSNTLSSQTTGSTPTTASTIAGGCNQLSQLQGVAEQLAQQRFSLQQQQQAPSAINQQLMLNNNHQAIQNPKIPVRWTALEAIAFRRFTSASDVWSFGVVCWEVMTEGERPYWYWSNQDVIKAVEQGYRLPQPEGCPEQLYKLMLDCWLKERAARPTFGQILKTIDRLLSPYDDPFCPPMIGSVGGGDVQQQQQLVPMQTRSPLLDCTGRSPLKDYSYYLWPLACQRISANQGPAYYDTYNPISQLLSNKSDSSPQQQSVCDWLDSIKMSRYKENFQRHQINSIQYAARLSQAELNLIGIQNNQHVKKILNAIASLRSSSSIGASGEGYLV